MNNSIYKNRSFSAHIHYDLLLHIIICCLAAIVACTNVQSHDALRPEFDVLTSQGPISVRVQGTATGFTNADLSRLIRSGMAEAYSVRCSVPFDTWSMKQILVWNVAKDGRHNYVVSGRLVQSGKIIKSTWVDVIGLEAAPYGVFMRTISFLALKLLPPATERRTRFMLDDCS